MNPDIVNETPAPTQDLDFGPCPQCGGTMTPDNSEPDSRWCVDCAEAAWLNMQPTVICVRFTNGYVGSGPRHGDGISAAQHATAALRRHGITRTQVLAVNVAVYDVPSERDPVEHLYYTLEVPASVADALAAEGQGR